ncbi:uncharacterized protein TNCV_1844081 [Trichonephila clavipes]|nr:uncharacterized protein TNCV_1844081 [Trichonephila clavipes]
MDEILTTARDLELEVNEDDIEELIMGHEDELTTEELQEILNEEHQETQRNVSPSEQEEVERGPMPTCAIKDLLKKFETECYRRPAARRGQCASSPGVMWNFQEREVTQECRQRHLTVVQNYDVRNYDCFQNAT